jgi:hypothetical protein
VAVVNRVVVRALLMPGILQQAGARGVPFTEEETEAVVQAYVDAAETGDGRGIDAAIIVLRRFTEMPLALRRRHHALCQLRSVSEAYRLSQIPPHFRGLPTWRLPS